MNYNLLTDEELVKMAQALQKVSPQPSISLARKIQRIFHNRRDKGRCGSRGDDIHLQSYPF